MPAPYTTPADVQAMNRALVFGQGQNPTTNDVTTFIQMVQGDIDLVLLRAGVQAPVDFTATPAPVAQEVLRRINAQGALAMAAEAAPSFPPALRAQVQKTYSDAIQGLSALVPRLDLPTNPLDTEPRGPGVTQNPESYPDAAPYASLSPADSANQVGSNVAYFYRGQRF